MNDEQVGFFTAGDAPYGKSYGEWTVEWWRWILGIPKRVSPVVDVSGEYTAMNQQNRDVYFLAGKLAEERDDLPERYCKISAYKSILVPVINSESSMLENPELRNDDDIVQHVKNDQNTIVKKQFYLDGKVIRPERISSDPPVFDVYMVDDSLFTVGPGRMTRASADGYWIFLKPLPRGEHTISFHGSCEMGRLRSGAIYKIDIE
jgi:hypothetical protein